VIEVIVLDEFAVYSTEVESEERLNEISNLWEDMIDDYCNACNTLYKRLFRTAFGIPVDCTSLEEREFILSKYGKTPIRNDEYTDTIFEINAAYEEREEPAPEFTQLAEELGLVLTEKVHTLNLYG